MEEALEQIILEANNYQPPPNGQECCGAQNVLREIIRIAALALSVS